MEIVTLNETTTISLCKLQINTYTTHIHCIIPSYRNAVNIAVNIDMVGKYSVVTNLADIAVELRK